MNERDILAQKDFAVKEALAKGLVEGRAEGETKEKRETAKILLEKGMDISFISEVTRLSKEKFRACEIAAKNLMNERDILAQKDFAVKEACREGHKVEVDSPKTR